MITLARLRLAVFIMGQGLFSKCFLTGQGTLLHIFMRQGRDVEEFSTYLKLSPFSYVNHYFINL